MNILILGPPGVGKGTQADNISRKIGIPKISTGDIFRENIAKKTELGKKVKAILDRGELVSDEIVNEIVKKRLSENDCKNGFILDGFPRSINQAKALEGYQKIDVVINLNVDDKVCIDRIAGRYTCKNCQAIYNVRTAPKPKKEGICDKCGGQLYQRDDQKEEVVKHRLEVYKQQTKPLIDYYTEKKLIVNVNGNPDIEKVWIEIEKAIDKKQKEIDKEKKKNNQK